MAYTDPRSVFSIHSIVCTRRTTGVPYGILRVVQGGEISLTGDSVDLFGGSSRFPWASEVGDIESEFQFTASEYPDFMFELFLGASVTQTSADTDGSVSSVTNLNGTSVVNASTGMTATLTVGTAADLKFGRLIFVATDSTHVDVYITSNIDETKGTDLTYVNDALKITSSPLAVSSGGTVAIPGTGLTINGGSGTIALVTGDTAYADVLPIHTGRSKIVVGSASTVFPEFGARMSAAKRANGEIFEIEAYKCVGNGMPIGLTRNEWAEPEMTMKLLRDSTLNAVFAIEAVKGST